MALLGAPEDGGVGERAFEGLDAGSGGAQEGHGGAGASSSLKANVKVQGKPFVLRRGRPHELDLLAVLSTDVFTPRGKWYEVFQNIKHLLIVWDLQAQFYNRFYNCAKNSCRIHVFRSFSTFGNQHKWFF